MADGVPQNGHVGGLLQNPQQNGHVGGPLPVENPSEEQEKEKEENVDVRVEENGRVVDYRLAAELKVADFRLYISAFRQTEFWPWEFDLYVQQWQPDDDETLKFAIKKYGSNKFKIKAIKKYICLKHFDREDFYLVVSKEDTNADFRSRLHGVFRSWNPGVIDVVVFRENGSRFDKLDLRDPDRMLSDHWFGDDLVYLEEVAFGSRWTVKRKDATTRTLKRVGYVHGNLDESVRTLRLRVQDQLGACFKYVEAKTSNNAHFVDDALKIPPSGVMFVINKPRNAEGYREGWMAGY